MKFDEILGNKERLLALGEEGSAYLDGLDSPDDYLTNRRLFYSRLVTTVMLYFASIVFVVFANWLTLVRPVGEPYVTTQAGQIIKIKDYKVSER